MQMSQPSIELSHILQDQNFALGDNSPGRVRTRSTQRLRQLESSGAASPHTGYRHALQRFESRKKERSPMTARAARFKSSDKKGFLKGNNSANDNDTTNLSSNGKMDATLDLAFTGKAD